MKAHGTFNIIVVSFIVVFTGFVGAVIFWPEADAGNIAPTPVQPQAVASAKPTENADMPEQIVWEDDDFEPLDLVDQQDDIGELPTVESAYSVLVLDSQTASGAANLSNTVSVDTGTGGNVSPADFTSSSSSTGTSSGTSDGSSSGAAPAGGSGASGGSTGSSTPAADSGTSTPSTPTNNGGAGAVIPDYSIPEWIETEGIRAGFFGNNCDLRYAPKLKAVGLNTAIVSRFCYSFDHLPEIMNYYQAHAQACKQAGMHMFASYVWQPGNEPTDPQYRSVVFADGSSGPFPCPLDENFWREYLIRIAVEIANISTKDSVSIIDGIFLDMELYGTEGMDFSKRRYSPTSCFCDHCFSSFILNRTNLTALPPVRKDRRESWLTQNGYLSDYYAYLGEQVEVKAELLKNSVHAINPKLLLGTYPSFTIPESFGPFWVTQSVMRAFGRDSYPAISFSTDTYGDMLKTRGANCIPADLPAHFEKYDINGIYVAGYMFRTYTSSEIRTHLIKTRQTAQGYWLFSMRQLLDPTALGELPLAGGSQADYLHAIKSANQTQETW